MRGCGELRRSEIGIRVPDQKEKQFNVFNVLSVADVVVKWIYDRDPKEPFTWNNKRPSVFCEQINFSIGLNQEIVWHGAKLPWWLHLTTHFVPTEVHLYRLMGLNKILYVWLYDSFYVYYVMGSHYVHRFHVI